MRTKNDADVLISGGGIAGPALAYCLRRRGFRATIVERAPAPRAGGQTVDLRGAARTVVGWMGLMDRVRAASLEQRGFACVDARGRVTARMPTDLFGGEGIVSDLEILRGDLSDVLYEATRDETEYVFDDSITGLVPDDDGVRVTFEKGSDRRFGIVVGADGLHSIVRSLAFGPESSFVRPLDCYLGWFTAKSDLDLDGWYLMHNAPGGLVASARPGRHPGELKVGLAFRERALDIDRRDTAAQKAIIAERFANVGWHVPDLLEAMHDAPDFLFESLGQVHLDRWSRGRVALLGDSAFCPSPLTGLGTSLAVVGAYVLAGELADAEGDHRVAFDRFESIMRPYVTKGQELPPGGIGGFAPRSALAISLRAASMRWMGRWPFRSLMAAQFNKAGDIDLPAYRQRSVSETRASV